QRKAALVPFRIIQGFHRSSPRAITRSIEFRVPVSAHACPSLNAPARAAPSVLHACVKFTSRAQPTFSCDACSEHVECRPIHAKSRNNQQRTANQRKRRRADRTAAKRRRNRDQGQAGGGPAG